jgi:hypothetical protein
MTSNQPRLLMSTPGTSATEQEMDFPTFGEILAPPPSCLSPALQLKREWSPWPEFGSDPGNPRELSKG